MSLLAGLIGLLALTWTIAQLRAPPPAAVRAAARPRSYPADPWGDLGGDLGGGLGAEPPRPALRPGFHTGAIIVAAALALELVAGGAAPPSLEPLTAEPWAVSAATPVTWSAAAAWHDGWVV